MAGRVRRRREPGAMRGCRTRAPGRAGVQYEPEGDAEEERREELVEDIQRLEGLALERVDLVHRGSQWGVGARGRRGEGRVALARGRLNLDFGDSFNGTSRLQTRSRRRGAVGT